MRSHLIFCGRIGSGKTRVSKAVGRVLGLRWNSFGKTIKLIAGEHGLPTGRKDLQSLGEKMINEEPELLCQRVLTEAKPRGTQPIVIDGLRHREVQEILQRLLSPSPLLLVYVDVPDEIRRARIKVRDGLSDEEIRHMEEHSTEVQVGAELRKLANFTVDNSGPFDATVAAIIARV